MFEKFRESEWAFPFGVSAGVHVAVLLALLFIQMPYSKPGEHQTRPFRVKGVDNLPIVPGKPGGGDRPSLSKALQFVRQGSPLPSTVKDVPLSPSAKPLIEPKTEEALPKKIQTAVSPSAGTRDFETLASRADERQLREKVEVKQAPVQGSAVERLIAARSRAEQQGESLLRFLQQPLAALMTQTSPNLGVDPEEGMPGFTPGGSGGGGGGGTGPGSPGGSPDGEIGEARQDIVKYESLDNFLDIDVSTYEDKSGENYFMIRIFARKGFPVFTVMPKEILFTIDCSLSISPDRLDKFKKGITYCLRNLNKDDVFNIVAFKDAVQFFAPKSVAATPDTIKKAEKFVSGLTSSRRTDVYGAFARLVQTPLAKNPSNVMLLSDGRPTFGIVDSRELINSVTRANGTPPPVSPAKGGPIASQSQETGGGGKARPVFAFSGGAKVNRYLLDFIAYQNRGWSQFIKSTWDIDKGLAQFYDKIRDPIFIHLRYRLNGVDEGDVFPRSLPDFYKNAEFTLYGAYKKGEDRLSMQLLGDIEGQTKELVFTRSLASARKGGPDIMKGYAFNRIYHLISRHTTQPDPALLKEIRDLSARYGITTPYSPDLEKKHD